MSDIKECLGCGNQSDHGVSPFCSRPCEMAVDEAKQFSKDILLYESDDRRVFFYDFAFGDLCDLWSTYLLRRVRAKDLGKARMVDRALERLQKAILTKLNRHIVTPSCETRKTIVKTLRDLLFFNARIWEWKEKCWARSTPPNQMEWWDIQEIYKMRDSCRQTLDRLVDQVTMTEKTYDV